MIVEDIVSLKQRTQKRSKTLKTILESQKLPFSPLKPESILSVFWEISVSVHMEKLNDYL